jgi:hypothetical protein
MLLEHPLLGAAVEGDLRGFALARFPYTFTYSATAES